MKLISMTDFVLEQDKLMRHQLNDPITFTIKVTDYALFLKQPLTLGMFVPCDDDGNVLEIPTKENSNNTIDHDSKLMDYNDAKSKVLFNGFTNSKISGFDFMQEFLLFKISDYNSIECLLNNNHKIDFDLAVSF